MDMESLHAKRVEPGPTSERPSYKDAQVWKDLEAETGFASCADYFEFYKDVRPGYVKWLKKFQRLPKDHLTTETHLTASERPSIVIYDLSQQNDSTVRLILRRHCHSGIELIQALREPLGNTCVQLVLWFFDYGHLNQEMVDALVIGLKLGVRFLDDLRTVSLAQPRSHIPTTFRTSQIQSIVGNGTVATISQNFMADETSAVPVALVASIIHGDKDKNTLEEVLARGDDEEPPVRRPSLEESVPFAKTLDYTLERRGRIYARTVEHFIVQGRDATSTKAFLLLTALSPLLYAEAYPMINALNYLQDAYVQIHHQRAITQVKDDLNHYLHRGRQRLRRTVEVTEDHVDQIFGYLGSQAHSDWSSEPSYTSIRADLRGLIDHARRLETEIRDFMQLQVGNLALEESRRSIELSNSQIRETKSVKIFTILAFIYVPLNLAASIFGMNIQQLNGSGQKLWVFFTTAVAALLITGGSWLCSNHLANHEAVSWYRERATAKQAEAKKAKDDEAWAKREYGLLLRIAMLVWLVRNGRKAWLWNSRAWIAIAVDSNARGEMRAVADEVTACEYVWIHSRPGSDYDYWFPRGPRQAVTWSPLPRLLWKSSRPRDPVPGPPERSL